jgi:hypothetical protein
MKLFIHFDERGQVLSVAKVHAAGGRTQNPFLHVGRQEQVLELELTEEFHALDAHEIAEQYAVDVKQRKLMKKAAAKKKAAKKTARKKSGKKSPDR